jgi:serine/threonine protein kinase
MNDNTVSLQTVSETPDSRSGSSESVSRTLYGANDVIRSLYRVVDAPREGGFGRVYCVHHTGWDILLALKQPKENALVDNVAKAKFIEECTNLFRVNLHDNVVTCFYVRQIDGILSIFSEWMAGGSLSDWIYKTGKLYRGTPEEQLERILDISIQCARGLGWAHKKGLIHKDIKSDNLLMTDDGVAKIADFGIAEAKELYSKEKSYSKKYCSPEQMGGRPLTIQTDIWSWGVSVLEAFVGHMDWDNGLVAGYDCERYFNQAAIPMPEALKNILRRCFQYNPAERWDNFGEIEVLLREIYETETGRLYARPMFKSVGETAATLNNKALSYLDMEMPAEAEKCWQQALRKQPDHLDTIFNKTLYLWRNGGIDQTRAIEIVKDMYENDPDDPNKIWLYVNFCMEWHDHKTAKQLIDEKNLHNDKRYSHVLRAIRLSDKRFTVRWLLSDIVDTQQMQDQRRRFNQLVAEVKTCIQKKEIKAALKYVEKIFLMPSVHRPIRHRLYDEIGRYCRIKGVRALVQEREMGRADHGYTFNSQGYVISNGWMHDVVNDKYLHKFDESLLIYTFSPDDSLVFGVGKTGKYPLSVKVFDTLTGKYLFEFENAHDGAVNALAVSGNGRHLLSCSDDKTAKLWNIQKRRCIRVFHHEHEVKSAFFGPDANIVTLSMASHDSQGELISWHIRDQKRETLGEGISCASPNYDNGKVLAGVSGTLRLIDLRTLETNDVGRHKNPDYRISDVRFFPDERYALSVGHPGWICYWDLSSGRCLYSYKNPGVRLSLHPVGNYAIAYDADSSLIRIDPVYEFSGWADWHEDVRPYLEHFISRHPDCTKNDVEKILMPELQRRGYGWITLEGVTDRWEQMRNCELK